MRITQMRGTVRLVDFRLYDGEHTIMTFEGAEHFSITLENYV